MNPKNAEILKECVKGNRSAQISFYRHYSPALFATCLRIIGSPVEAEEAMHDAFLKIFDSFGKNVEFSSLDAWIHRIAINTAIDFLRNNRIVFEPLNDDIVADCEDDPPDEEDIEFSVARIKTACNVLPPGYRLVLSLYLFEGYDFEEIASILSVGVSTVRSQYLRGKRRLIEIIKRLPSE